MTEENIYSTLENAPIILAILEVRYNSPSTSKIDDLLVLNRTLSVKYPQYNKQYVGNISFENVKEETIASINPKVDSYIYMSSDKQRVLTLSLKNFNFQQRGKYSNWDLFKAEAKESWEICMKELQNINVTGISLRYINKIEIPVSVENPAEYFKTSIVSTSDASPSNVGSYQIRYIDYLTESHIHTIVAQQLEPGNGTTLPFIFDIDVHYTKQPNDSIEFLWEKFDELRTIKNRIFFKNLTDKTKNLFE